MKRIRIAIDGPAASGKGTVARIVAQSLGYGYIDTGALYRAVALGSLRAGVPWDDPDAVGAVAGALRLAFSWGSSGLRLTADGEDISQAIRTAEIGQGASTVAAHPPVRAALLGLQRSLAEGGGAVLDGRDIGTVVLPHAELKIFLDAAVEVRAQRRHDELLARGLPSELERVLAELRERDHRDSTRETAPLATADDAVVIDSSDRSAEEIAEEIVQIARDRLDGSKADG